MLIREAVFPADTAPLKAVIRKYIGWVDMDLSCRGFAQALGLPAARSRRRAPDHGGPAALLADGFSGAVGFFALPLATEASTEEA